MLAVSGHSVALSSSESSWRIERLRGEDGFGTRWRLVVDADDAEGEEATGIGRAADVRCCC